jgi:hypothetical protein
VAPFPLLTYADVAKHADGVAEETRKHRMPPWLPERTDLPILGERRFTPDQIATIQRWVDGGKVQGNASDLPKPPSFPDGWQFGRPDLVVSLARPYTLSPDGEDVYRNLVSRAPVSSDVFVRAVEFRGQSGRPCSAYRCRNSTAPAEKRRGSGCTDFRDS